MRERRSPSAVTQSLMRSLPTTATWRPLVRYSPQVAASFVEGHEVDEILKAKTGDRFGDASGALHGTDQRVEERPGNPSSVVLTYRPLPRRDLTSDGDVMLVEEKAPPLVAHFDGTAGRLDKIDEVTRAPSPSPPRAAVPLTSFVAWEAKLAELLLRIGS